MVRLDHYPRARPRPDGSCSRAILTFVESGDPASVAGSLCGWIPLPLVTTTFPADRRCKFAHALVGIGFSAASALHVLSHRRSFSNYYSQRAALPCPRARVVDRHRPGCGVDPPEHGQRRGAERRENAQSCLRRSRTGRGCRRYRTLQSPRRGGPRRRRPGDDQPATRRAVRRRGDDILVSLFREREDQTTKCAPLCSSSF